MHSNIHQTVKLVPFFAFAVIGLGAFSGTAKANLGEHVILANCVANPGVGGLASSQMAYFSGAPNANPAAIAIVSSGNFVRWETPNGSVSGTFADGNVFTSRIAFASQFHGQYVGTGNNTTDSFFCYEDGQSNLYQPAVGTSCQAIYDCNHTPPPPPSPGTTHPRGVFTTSDKPMMCINDGFQSVHNGDQIAINDQCSNSDPAALWTSTDSGQMLTDVGVCMDNQFGEQTNGNPVVIWECNNGDTQNWDWDGARFHYRTNPNKCLAVIFFANSDGGRLALWDCNDQGYERFVVQN